MIFEIILQKGIEKTSSFLIALFYVSTSIYKTVISLQKLFALLENIIKFPRAFSNQVLIFKYLQLYKTTFSCRQIVQIILYISKSIKDYIIIQKSSRDIFLLLNSTDLIHRVIIVLLEELNFLMCFA